VADRLDRNMFRYVLRFSARPQAALLVMIVASYPVQFLIYDATKVIINRAIGGEGPPFSARFLGLFEFSVEAERITFLLILCFVFLAAVVLNNGFKYIINNYKGRLAERLLRRLRYTLFNRVLRFPLPHFKRTSAGELISMITAEAEAVGNFFAGAIADPAFLGGQLVVATVFIFAQDWKMGLVALAVYPIQIYVVPRLQKKVSALSKARLREIRRLSDHVGESVGGIVDVHAHGTARLELARFSDRLGTIYNIRYEIYRRKYGIKFLNNFLDKVAPFFFYSIGGILVIDGEMTLGGLVAVLSAHKDMAAPWKELLAWYQQQNDASVKYEQIVTQFDPEGIADESLLLDEGDDVPTFTGSVALANVGLVDEDEVRRLTNITFDLTLDSNLAVVGAGSSGREDLALVLARLAVPSSGQIRIGDRDLTTISEPVIGRRIGYVGPAPSLQSTSVEENVLYGLKFRPVREAEYAAAEASQRRIDLDEATLAGNIDSDYRADWVDYAAAGVEGRDELFARIVDLFDLVELSDDVYRLGLRGTIDPEARPTVSEAVLQARRALSQKLRDQGMGGLVEHFDRARYNTNATVAENLLFGTPIGPRFDVGRLAENAYVLQILDKTGLTDDLLAVGREVAETMVEIFADLPPGHEFFEQYSFISSDDLPEFKTLLSRTERQQPAQLSPVDRAQLLSLPFRVIPAQHRLGVVGEGLQQRLLEARALFTADLPEELRGSVEFFDSERYNAASSLQDNILFGKIVYGQAGAEARIAGLIAETLDDLGLRGSVLEAGLAFEVGVGGGRLTLGQRQKLGLVRAMLKRPDLLVLNETTSALDPSVQDRIASNILEERDGRGVVWITNRPAMAPLFARIAVLEEGRLVELGSYAELGRDGTALRRLLQSA
jgi:ABC-type multidrug transport system fused ATPase/permease subunit